MAAFWAFLAFAGQGATGAPASRPTPAFLGVEKVLLELGAASSNGPACAALVALAAIQRPWLPRELRAVPHPPYAVGQAAAVLSGRTEVQANVARIPYAVGRARADAKRHGRQDRRPTVPISPAVATGRVASGAAAARR